MEIMEKYKIMESIKDVIRILDSAPIRPDLNNETNMVQLTNRGPIAHLAIERGLKALIFDAGGTEDRIHELHILYNCLKTSDKKSADFLSTAFGDAVQFFGYTVKENRLGHLASIDMYLSKVGTKKVFDAMRYWSIGIPGKGGNLLPFIQLPIHRELLYALWCYFADKNPNPITVSDRVDQKVAHAMFNNRKMIWASEDKEREQSIQWYAKWLMGHRPRRGALQEAVRKDFSIKNNEFIKKTLREAYAELKQSDDPAVKYFINTLAYLSKDSQHRDPHAIPHFEWLNKTQTSGLVKSPGGTDLGFIEKYANGTFGIMPCIVSSDRGFGLEEGAIARSLEDAKHYMVNHCTIKIAIKTGKEKEAKYLRAIGKKFHSKGGWAGETQDSPEIFQLDFWDDKHGLSSQENISIRIPKKLSRGKIEYEYDYVIKGEITEVSQQKVSIAGESFYDLRKDL